MAILSIQSCVSYGHVGNSAAVFPLQRLGFEVWPVPTVQFSNHPGHGRWRGMVMPPTLVAELIQGIAALGVLPHCEAVLSGYLGEPETGSVVLEAVAAVKAANPQALYCCDPVMGDVGSGFFVPPPVRTVLQERMVGAADIVTPNQFELEALAGWPVTDLDSALAAAEALRARGPALVLVTSLCRRNGPPDAIEMLALSAAGAWLVATPLLPVSVNGAGDASAALFLAQYLLRRDPAAALALTASAIYAVVEATHRAGCREIQVVAAQARIAAVEARFPVTRLR